MGGAGSKPLEDRLRLYCGTGAPVVETAAGDQNDRSGSIP